ncbi:phosphoglucomutase/phosphomannomutase family protein [Candidatus Oleimmundimicrobium sp.]|uniref:phosphoglucomutase/phosphomannomutase family protein n=1 Tax=Candidatus Oleimmundimicrobium sp. TaxID=3060597 RepID=UPI00271E8034|nr:phosphoglucomutase/phosphomannomutase family protein [Candidatus Oleimmundimicrobium sp.]MDO8885313.1 phosphoglucomutase/phosphomannomutase family protein [Candidatus Oleimmundimicrobium sp.]
MRDTIKFGTDGWRAIMCDSFIFKNVRIVTQAIANYLHNCGLSEKGVVIGYDNRFCSEDFADVCASVLIGNKIPVFLIKDSTPTPVTACSINFFKAAGAIMLTASHNPAKYNGLKFVPEYAGPATSEITSQIEKEINLIFKNKKVFFDDTKGNDLLHVIDPVDRYLEHLKGLINFEVIREAKLKIAFDPMYGSGQVVMKKVLEEAGCEVYPINDYRDVLFGGRLPEPSLENLSELQSLVLSKKADLGLALDGDADRFGTIDNKGYFLSSNQGLSVLCSYLLGDRKSDGKVVRTISTTHLLDKIAAKFGVKFEETPVGFKYIGQIMLKEPVVIGGEESGGLSILGHVPEKDGILAGLLFCEVTANKNESLSNLLDEIYSEYGHFYNYRLDIHCSQDKKTKLLRDLKNNPPSSISGLKVNEVLLKDGVKFLLEGDSWILIRPSGTEPLVRIYMESCSTKTLENLRQYAETLLN